MPELIFKTAQTPEELKEYFALRHEVFVKEQKIFPQSDVDGYDREAVHLVAIDSSTGRIVGGVRCYQKEEEGNTWFGGRLSVLPAYRNGQIGARLVRLAMETVKSRGCKNFLAYIQTQNVNFFEKLGWRALGEPMIYEGLPHRLMEADLNSL